MSGTIEDFRPAFAAMGIDEMRVHSVEVEHDEEPYRFAAAPPELPCERGVTVIVRLFNGRAVSHRFAPGEVYARRQATAMTARYVRQGEPGRDAYLGWQRKRGRETAAAARRLGMLDNMPTAHRRVFEARWPETGRKPTATLKELSDELGLSRERIRQIENSEIRRVAYVLGGWSQQEIGLGVARCPVAAVDGSCL